MISIFLIFKFAHHLCESSPVSTGRSIGPGVFNRIAAVNVIGTKTIALLVLIGYYTERPEFFDIALLYAMLNFIGTLVFARYLERGELWS